MYTATFFFFKRAIWHHQPYMGLPDAFAAVACAHMLDDVALYAVCGAVRGGLALHRHGVQRLARYANTMVVECMSTTNCSRSSVGDRLKSAVVTGARPAFS